jgi:hypothetical protein
MRTVTFAEPTVIDYLKNHFVLLWHNQTPGRNGDGPATPEEAGAYDEGGGGDNIRTYVCTADGAICYYFTGYWAGERYLAQLRFGHGLAVKSMLGDGAARQEMAGKELTGHLFGLSAERRRLREEHGAALYRKTSLPARDDARLAQLERSVGLSADLYGSAIAPILIQFEIRNVPFT